MQEELDQQLKPHLAALLTLRNQIQSQAPEDSKQRFQDEVDDLGQRSALTGDQAAERLQRLNDLEGRWAEYDDALEKFTQWLDDVNRHLDGIKKEEGSPEDVYKKAKVLILMNL